MRRAVSLTCLIASAALVIGAVFDLRRDRGLRGYDEYRALLREEGADASSALLWNVALTGLDLGKGREIEILAERLAARGGSEWFARRDLLLAAESWRRSKHSEMLADRPEGGLPELDEALEAAELAVNHWSRAWSRDPSFSPARRNAQRGLARVARLEEKRARLRNAAKSDDDGNGPKSEETLPDDGSGGEGDPETHEDGALGQGDSALSSALSGFQGELAPDEVRDLADKLESKREEKRALRRARLRERRHGGAAW